MLLCHLLGTMRDDCNDSFPASNSSTDRHHDDDGHDGCVADTRVVRWSMRQIFFVAFHPKNSFQGFSFPKCRPHLLCDRSAHKSFFWFVCLGLLFATLVKRPIIHSPNHNAAQLRTKKR